MKPDQFAFLVDPDTGSELALTDVDMHDGHVRSGKLVSRDQRCCYPVNGFIPSFVPGATYASNFGLQWQKHSRVQLDSHNGSSYSRDRLYATAGWESGSRFEGEKVLEAGCGAGRFTEVLAETGAAIFSFDLSSAVYANFANNGMKDNVAILQADIYRPPFRKHTFDHVVCVGVLQHTPDVRKAFMSLAGMVRPGGRLIVDVYPRVWRQTVHWKYVLRPVTRRMDPERLYRYVEWIAPKLMPAARLFYKLGGKALRRLVPVMDQSDKNVSPAIQREWTVLDTYDALAARYDQPQTARTMRLWFEQAGFTNLTYDNAGFPTAGMATRS